MMTTAYTIGGLTDNSHQQNTIRLPNGSDCVITLNFQWNRWMFDFNYEDFNVYCIHLVTTDNILQQYSYVFPYALQVFSKDKADPYFIDDFITNRITLQFYHVYEN